jgi:hypothetical protein
MSYDLVVYGPAPDASTRAAWQGALDGLASGIVLPAEVDPARWTGGLVALGPGDPPPGFVLVRRALDAGELDPASTGPQPSEVATRLAAAALAFDLSAPFTSDAAEWSALWLAAGALAAALDGVLRDPQADTFVAAPAAIGTAQAAVAAGSGAAAAALVPTPWGLLGRADAETRARAQNLPPLGRHTVTLVAASGSHPALVRTVGDALGAGDGRARSALRDLPLVLVTGVSRTYADDLASRLAGFGATAVVG